MKEQKKIRFVPGSTRQYTNTRNDGTKISKMNEIKNLKEFMNRIR